MGHISHRPPGPKTSPDQSEPSIDDRRSSVSLAATKPMKRGASHRTLVHSLPPRLCLHLSERARRPARRLTRGAAPSRVCSPAGDAQRAIIEQLCCDALSWEPEPVNPRVGAGEPRVPFLDFDEVGSGDGRPK
jgi:hypothetical protein